MISKDSNGWKNNYNSCVLKAVKLEHPLVLSGSRISRRRGINESENNNIKNGELKG